MLRIILYLILILLTHSVSAKDVVILFDQTSSVMPAKSNSKTLLSEITLAINSFFSDEELNSYVWKVEKGNFNDLQNSLKNKNRLFHLISFGGASMNTETSTCSIDFIEKDQAFSSNSSQLDTELQNFYSPHIYGASNLNNPKYESPELAQWQVWQNIKKQNIFWREYYQIVISDGGAPKDGDCQNDQTIQERINNWSSQNNITELLVLKYEGDYSKNKKLRITVNKISSLESSQDIYQKIYQINERLEKQLLELQNTTKLSATIGLLITIILVILMQAGFALLEVGFNAAKNAVNIMFKNFMDFSIGVILFFLIGYALMFGNSYGGFVGFDISHLALNGLPSEKLLFLFHAVFAATAATIFSGSVAGRLKLTVYIWASIAITVIIYPISGHWAWAEGGWLQQLGFHDFAGSVVVHAVGGFAGLAGALVLGSRLGRLGYMGNLSAKNDKSLLDKLKYKDLLPHNLSLAGLGVFLLWIGWYGFNIGGVFAANDTDQKLIATIALNTTLSAAAGAVTVMLINSLLSRYHKKPFLNETLNGAIAGLVAITASCDAVEAWAAISIGIIAGLILLEANHFMEKSKKIDDPVSAWIVHGICGIWGGIAYGVYKLIIEFDYNQLLVQVVGSFAIALWSFSIMFIFFNMLNKLLDGGIRVDAKTEIDGLDISTHSEKAYSDVG